MAGALAGRALAGGNPVEIVGRDPVKAKQLAAVLGGATVGTRAPPRPGTSSSSPCRTPVRRVPGAPRRALGSQSRPRMHHQVVGRTGRPGTSGRRGDAARA
ncbi:hypothetical protein [Mycobacterium sp. URHB0021]